mgnify:CR=1 FL=1
MVILLVPIAHIISLGVTVAKIALEPIVVITLFLTSALLTTSQNGVKIIFLLSSALVMTLVAHAFIIFLVMLVAIMRLPVAVTTTLLVVVVLKTVFHPYVVIINLKQTVLRTPSITEAALMNWAIAVSLYFLCQRAKIIFLELSVQTFAPLMQLGLDTASTYHCVIVK